MKLQYILCLLIAAIVCVQSRDDHEHKHPKFCKNSDCPHYATKNESKLFETRIYEETPWVHVKLEGNLMRSIMRKSFYKLFFYITGRNEEGRKMDMTVPVMTIFTNIDQSIIKADVHFYMPLKYGKLPKPLDSTVQLSSTPRNTKYYVRVFKDSVRTLTQIRKKHNELLNDLQKEGMKFDKTKTYLASYNKPGTPKSKRHTEIWIAASQ